MRLLIHRSLSHCQTHIEYAVRHLLRAAAVGAGADALTLSYGPTRPPIQNGFHLHVWPSAFFGDDYGSTGVLPSLPLERLDDLPILYGGRQGAWSERHGPGAVSTRADVIAGTFFMLSRYEETVAGGFDKYGRFQASDSVGFKEGFLGRPIVDEYAGLVRRFFEEAGARLPAAAAWPGGRQHAACLTHDVDTLRKYSWTPPLRRAARSPLRLAALLWDFAAVHLRLREDTYATLNDVRRAEEARGLRGSYYFLVGARGPSHPNVGPHRSAAAEKAVNDLLAAGHEVGIHPGYFTWRDLELTRSEKREVERMTGDPVAGGRQHMLRWKAPDTWRLWNDLGLEYDSTLTFADHEGFRCGTSWPFRAFDVTTGEVLDLWELPLTVMDNSLSDYRRLGPDEGFARMRGLHDRVQRAHGCFVVLWHHNFADPFVRPGWLPLWPQLLDHLMGSGAWIATAREIVSHVAASPVAIEREFWES